MSSGWQRCAFSLKLHEGGFLFLDTVMSVMLLLVILSGALVTWNIQAYYKQELIAYARESQQHIRLYQQRNIFRCNYGEERELLSFKEKEWDVYKGGRHILTEPYPKHIERRYYGHGGDLMFSKDGKAIRDFSITFRHKYSSWRARLVFAAQTGRLRMEVLP